MPKNVIKEKEDFQRYILDYLKNKNGYVVRDAKTCFNSHYAMEMCIRDRWRTGSHM